MYSTFILNGISASDEQEDNIVNQISSGILQHDCKFNKSIFENG